MRKTVKSGACNLIGYCFICAGIGEKEEEEEEEEGGEVN